MKKQKSRLSLGFLLLSTACFVSAIPLKVYAGQDVVRGTSVESSTFSGDSFNGKNQGVPTIPSSLGTGVSIEVNGTINVSQEIQQSLNGVARNIVQSVNSRSTTGSGSNLTSIVVAILVQGATANTAINQIQTSLLSVGVPQSLITALVNNLAGLFQGFNSAAMSSVPIAGVQPVQLVASTQLAQGRENSKVDINQLNAAVKAYNNIVLKSDAQTLEKLSKNPEFLEIGRVLKELRTSLKAK